LEVFSTTVDGSRRVLDFSVSGRAEAALFVSSGAAYGKSGAVPEHVQEDWLGALDPSDACSAYGAGKRAAESLFTAYQHDYGLNVKIARCFTFAGRYMDSGAGYALTDFVCDALRGGPIVVRDDGTARRSYLDGRDLAVWLWGILLRGSPGRTYNVGSEEIISIGELANAVAGMCRPGLEVRICSSPAQGRPIDAYVPSTRRAREELGLRQTVQFADSLRDTIDWTEAKRVTQANERSAESGPSRPPGCA
jgi:dTDP-glucose 4,6-dehydratase